MSFAGLDELSEENWKRITQQNGKGEASSDSYHENPLSLMLKDTLSLERLLICKLGSEGGEGSVKPTGCKYPFPTLTMAGCKLPLKVIRGNSFGLASR